MIPGIKRKRGDVREDGKVFWGLVSDCKGGEYWVAPEKFAEKKARHAHVTKRWAQSHPENRRETTRKQRERHPERAKERIDSWRKDNLDQVRAYSRQYHAKHNKHCRRRNSDWKKRNPEKVKAHNLKQYGLTYEQYQEMGDACGWRCQICGTHKDETKDGRFHVDHCHDTQVVRGLLCGLCNRGLGMFSDNPELIRKAADYLEARDVSQGDRAAGLQNLCHHH
jgi:hypothetical protein